MTPRVLVVDNDAEQVDLLCAVLKREGYDVEGFTSGATVGPVRMSDIRIRDGSMAMLGFFYDFADPNLIKAGWNWLLVDNDGTLGVHNPSFAYNLMAAAIDALNPGAAASIDWPSWVTPSAPPAPR